MQSYEYMKSLYMRAKRRGMLELDLLMGYVADNYLWTMTESQLKRFDELLQVSDEVIFKWVTKQEEVPRIYDNDVWKIIESYKIPASSKSEEI